MKKLFISFILVSVLAFGGAWKSGEVFTRTSIDEDVKVTLKAIAIQNGSDIIFGKSVNGKESLSVKDMQLEGAFNMILEKHNLEYRWEGNTILIKSKKSKTKQKSFIILKKLKINKLKKLMNKYGLMDKFNREGGENKIIFDEDMNSIFLDAEFSIIKELERLVNRFEMAESIKIADKEKNDEEKRKKQKQLENSKEKDRLYQMRLVQDKKKEKYGQSKYDTWSMIVKMIPLKYINVGSTEVEFQGKKVQVDSLEDTLKGLLGTTEYVRDEIDIRDSNESSKPLRLTYNSKNKEKPYLKINKRTNSIIVKDYPDRIEEIEKILKDLDKPIELVKIDVTVAFGNTGFTRQLGTNLRMRGQGGYINASSSGGQILKPSNALGLSASMVYLGAKNTLNASLVAMEEKNLGKVLSNPSIVTLDGKEAEIYSGNSVSVPTATSDKMELETITTGISIKTTPQIISKKGNDEKDKDILLDIDIENSSLENVSKDQISTSKSTIKTSVIIKNNRTLILGGMFDYSETSGEGGIPLLKDIPLLGYLFKTKNRSLTKHELLFFITPQIIKTDMIMGEQKKHYDYNQDLDNKKKTLTKNLNNIGRSNLEKFNDKYK